MTRRFIPKAAGALSMLPNPLKTIMPAVYCQAEEQR
uniref:Uncharacterized protein n=1 Tax=Serratia marcescens TaxID=615 RepID=A0A1C3HH36_SERMA|nr:Uncharacterised protein [Serratia marcescens]